MSEPVPDPVVVTDPATIALPGMVVPFDLYPKIIGIDGVFATSTDFEFWLRTALRDKLISSRTVVKRSLLQEKLERVHDEVLDEIRNL